MKSNEKLHAFWIVAFILVHRTRGQQCGNGILEVPEACDDANSIAGDGCSPQCVAEEGWRCWGVEGIDISNVDVLATPLCRSIGDQAANPTDCTTIRLDNWRALLHYSETFQPLISCEQSCMSDIRCISSTHIVVDANVELCYLHEHIAGPVSEDGFTLSIKRCSVVTVPPTEPTNPGQASAFTSGWFSSVLHLGNNTEWVEDSQQLQQAVLTDPTEADIQDISWNQLSTADGIFDFSGDSSPTVGVSVKYLKLTVIASKSVFTNLVFATENFQFEIWVDSLQVEHREQETFDQDLFSIPIELHRGWHLVVIKLTPLSVNAPFSVRTRFGNFNFLQWAYAPSETDLTECGLLNSVEIQCPTALVVGVPLTCQINGIPSSSVPLSRVHIDSNAEITGLTSTSISLVAPTFCSVWVEIKLCANSKRFPIIGTQSQQIHFVAPEDISFEESDQSVTDGAAQTTAGPVYKGIVNIPSQVTIGRYDVLVELVKEEWEALPTLVVTGPGDAEFSSALDEGITQHNVPFSGINSVTVTIQSADYTPGATSRNLFRVKFVRSILSPGNPASLAFTTARIGEIVLATSATYPSVTLEFVLKFYDTTLQLQTLLKNRAWEPTALHLEIFQGSLRLGIQNNNPEFITFNTALPLQSWSKLTIAYNSVDRWACLYLNPQDTVECISLIFAQPARIGPSVIGSHDFIDALHADVQEIRIWNTALPPLSRCHFERQPRFPSEVTPITGSLLLRMVGWNSRVEWDGILTVENFRRISAVYDEFPVVSVSGTEVSVTCIPERDCNSGGKCFFDDTCDCFYNFIGEFCEECALGYLNHAEGCLPDCNAKKCTVHGRCTDNNLCSCDPGWFGDDCSSAVRKCYGWGDPHYMNWEGKKFDFMGLNKYLLTEIDGIRIEVENWACVPPFPVSCHRRAAFVIARHVLEFDKEGTHLWNGRPFDDQVLMSFRNGELGFTVLRAPQTEEEEGWQVWDLDFTSFIGSSGNSVSLTVHVRVALTGAVDIYLTAGGPWPLHSGFTTGLCSASNNPESWQLTSEETHFTNPTPLSVPALDDNALANCAEDIGDCCEEYTSCPEFYDSCILETCVADLEDGKCLDLGEAAAKSGLCNCPIGKTGENCDKCARNFYGKECDAWCDNFISCGGKGVCNNLGACECYGNWTYNRMKGTECAQCEGPVCPGPMHRLDMYCPQTGNLVTIGTTNYCDIVPLDEDDQFTLGIDPNQIQLGTKAACANSVTNLLQMDVLRYRFEFTAPSLGECTIEGQQGNIAFGPAVMTFVNPNDAVQCMVICPTHRLTGRIIECILETTDEAGTPAEPNQDPIVAINGEQDGVSVSKFDNRVLGKYKVEFQTTSETRMVATLNGETCFSSIFNYILTEPEFGCPVEQQDIVVQCDNTVLLVNDILSRVECSIISESELHSLRLDMFSTSLITNEPALTGIITEAPPTDGRPKRLVYTVSDFSWDKIPVDLAGKRATVMWKVLGCDQERTTPINIRYPNITTTIRECNQNENRSIECSLMSTSDNNINLNISGGAINGISTTRSAGAECPIVSFTVIPYQDVVTVCTSSSECVAVDTTQQSNGNGTSGSRAAVVWCGDGYVNILESCDDNNTLNGDGCDRNCSWEPGWICFGANPSVCRRANIGGITPSECEGNDDDGSSTSPILGLLIGLIVSSALLCCVLLLLGLLFVKYKKLSKQHEQQPFNYNDNKETEPLSPFHPPNPNNSAIAGGGAKAVDTSHQVPGSEHHTTTPTEHYDPLAQFPPDSVTPVATPAGVPISVMETSAFTVEPGPIFLVN